MKYFFIALILTLSLWAQSGYAQYDQAKAKEILSNSLSKYKAYSDFKASFDMLVENRMDEEKIEQKGTIWLKKDKYRIETEEQVIATDLKKMWVYLKEAKEVQISEYVAEEQEINPASFFTFWETGYLYGYAGDEMVNGKLSYLIEMTPNNKELTFFKIKVYIDKASKELKQLKVYNKGGTILTFNLSSVKANNGIKDDFFIFKKSEFPGAEVIDLTE